MTILGLFNISLVEGFGHKLVCGTGAPVMGCLVITVLGSGLDLWEELTEPLDGGGGAEGRGTEAWRGGEEGRGAGEARVVEAEGPGVKVDWGSPPLPDRPIAANFFFTPCEKIDQVGGEKENMLLLLVAVGLKS